MAKKERTDRQAVIDSIRNKQKGREKRRGFAIVGFCVVVAVLIVAAAAYKPIKDWYDLRTYSSKTLEEIGADADACGEITTKKANGTQDHVPPGTPIAYEDSPPAFGQHYDAPDPIQRKLYTTSDRPDVGTLVHNLEHGYTILWYDKTVAEDDSMMDDLRGIADKLEGTKNFRDKFKAVPWTSKDGEPFPGDQHVALTHWSIGGATETAEDKQVGVFQYCTAPSGAALAEFMKEYPYLDSPEPGAG